MAATSASDSGEKGDMRLKNIEIVRSKSGESSTLKYLSLVVLVVQNASQVLLIRYARMRVTEERFLSTSAVFWTEVVKLSCCVLIVSAQEKSFLRCVRMMYEQIVGQPIDTLKVCVPSIIYTIQNNLLYVAVSNLAAATFMVTYQLKILTTALFSVIMLKKSLSKLQWFSLIMLFLGVSIVQLTEQNKHAPASTTQNNTLATGQPAASAYTQPAQSPTLGLTCVVVACLLSGFSGIYFEKILKGSADISVWMRNIQLAVLSIPISYVTMQAKDGVIVAEKGMLVGFDRVVWLIVAVYALGGLTVAVVIKYADNILKGFATSVSIVVSCVVSVYLFDFIPSGEFVVGTALVILSIYVYSKFPYKSPQVLPHVTPKS